jgi:hypothetical protein
LLLVEVGGYKRQEWNITTDQPGIPLSGIGATDNAMAGYVKADYVPQKEIAQERIPIWLSWWQLFPPRTKLYWGCKKLKEELPRGLHIRLKEPLQKFAFVSKLHTRRCLIAV